MEPEGSLQYSLQCSQQPATIPHSGPCVALHNIVFYKQELLGPAQFPGWRIKWKTGKQLKFWKIMNLISQLLI
jgi:hypothetical protein